MYVSNVTPLMLHGNRFGRLILKHINRDSREQEFIHDLSNEEIANLTGSTRAVGNRHLQQFKNDGTINIGRPKIEIKNLNLLLDKVDGKFKTFSSLLFLKKI